MEVTDPTEDGKLFQSEADLHLNAHRLPISLEILGTKKNNQFGFLVCSVQQSSYIFKLTAQQPILLLKYLDERSSEKAPLTWLRSCSLTHIS